MTRAAMDMGKATAERFAKAGAKVVVAEFNEKMIMKELKRLKLQKEKPRLLNRRFKFRVGIKYGKVYI